jgi:hypothetical protein
MPFTMPQMLKEHSERYNLTIPKIKNKRKNIWRK